ncbi:glycan-binding surface protein [Mangrovibacterium lignilyticum]|uniref:glycan-binding surface protein n=1 Tax=Mangrovibacterium lignilyticum TaxID=2668052 RepID=UPI0013D2681D|nr:glycan-binding surface protein [Mangrovibacterium lignilyticum]
MKNRLNNKIKHFLLILILFVAGASMVLVSCNDDDDDNGGSKIELFSYGPMPIARGAELKFIGENLDQVTSIILPDNIEISAAEFTSVTSTLLTLTVPQTAEVGFVTLKTPQGDIVTKTQMGYSEPIAIDAFTPDSIKPGSELTITGEYLNLIAEVIFSDNISIDSTLFTSQSRKELKLIVPAEAQTGPIAISNGAADPIVIATEDTLYVTLPEIGSFTPAEIKAGETLTLSGTDLDLVKTVVFSGNKSVGEDVFVSQSATEIEVTVPVDAQDGTIAVITASNLKIESVDELTMMAPTITAIAPNPGKTGADLTITGVDLDLVSVVTFSGDVEATIVSQSETEIQVTVPDEAVTGPVTVSTLSNKSAVSAELSLVKPTITAIDPMALIAGNDITITGTDLDLVRSVVFNSNLSVDVAPDSETSLTVTVPEAAESGTIKLVTINGDQVESTESLDITTPNTPVITSITSEVYPGQLMVIEGTKLNFVESVIFQDGIKATQYGIRSETMIEVYVPENATSGTVTLKLIAFDLTEITSPEFKIPGTDPILPTTIMINDYEQHGDHNGYWDNSWSGISEILEENGNTFFRINSEASGDAWLINCNHQANGALGPVVANIDNYAFKLDVRIEEGVTGAENAALQFVLGDGWYWYGSGLLPASTNGKWITISVPATALGLSGTLDLSSGTNGLYGGPIPAGISFDNFRLDLK